jgi:hypothetical protein
MHEGKPHSWDDDDTYWRSNYASRPYASGSSNYDQWRGAYRYGFESANRYSGRNWNDVESDLSKGWNSYEYRGTSTWEQIKGAVRDAWDRVTGRHPVGTR